MQVLTGKRARQSIYAGFFLELLSAFILTIDLRNKLLERLSCQALESRCSGRKCCGLSFASWPLL